MNTDPLKKIPEAWRIEEELPAGKPDVDSRPWTTGGLRVDMLDFPDNLDYEPRHASGCICADCSDAELTADND